MIGTKASLSITLFRRIRCPKSSVIGGSERFYHVSPVCQRKPGAKKNYKLILTPEERKRRKLMAQDYNNRRAAYKREVSQLRKQYAVEIAEQLTVDTQKEQEERDRITRKRLERQRLKNIKSAQNALRQEAIRKAREEEFNEHLRKEQIKREAHEKRMTAARQKVIDILEKEAPLWLMTPEEIEAAFTPETEQRLWARPGGFIGAPNPSLDSHFWQHESHTWHMDKTYPLMREVLLRKMEDFIYQEANLNLKYWTPERLAEQYEIEQRARLRAMVREEGRRELLRKQRELLADVSRSDDDVPKKQPVPSRAFLHDIKAIEKEGFELLLRDPTRFFVFENQDDTADQEESDETIQHSMYKGSSLGSPIRLRDPLRDNSPDGNVWPQMVGYYEEERQLTEKEKKQAERERKMWAAAHAAERERHERDGTLPDEVDEDQLGEDVDYDNNEWEKEREAEWKKNLDPIKDADIYNAPPDLRYTLKDINWVIDSLEEKANYQTEKLTIEVENLKQDLRSNIIHDPANESKQIAEGSIAAVVLNLPAREILALSDLDEMFMEKEPTDDDLSDAMKQVPSLEKEQLRAILTRDRSM